MRPELGIAVLALAAALTPLLAVAQAPPRILVRTDVPGVAAPLRAELATLGFDTRAGGGVAPSELTLAALAALARDADALAVVAVRPVEGGLELWIFDGVTQKIVLRRVVVDALGDTRTAALLAVELLRASFLEIQLVADEPSDTPAPPAEVLAMLPAPRARAPEARTPEARVAAAARLMTLRVGGLLSLDPGGLGAGGHVELDVGLRAHSGFAAHAWSVLPTAPLVVTAPEGRADVTVVAAGLGAAWQPLDPRGQLDLRGSVGVGFAWLRAVGTATAPYTAGADDAALALARAELSLTYWPVRGLGAYVSVASLVGASRASIEFGERVVATWGQPTVTLSAGLSLAAW